MATSWVGGNYYISQSDMENNAQMFYAYMHRAGFTLEAIAGMLGNIQHESGINPGIWEGLNPYWRGYGLVQWTPYTKYSEWAGAGWENNGDKECERITWEFDNGEQWSLDYAYSVDMTSQQFKVSRDTPETLAIAFLWNYENPYVEDAQAKLEKEQERSSAARTWYNYLLETVAYTPRLSYEGTDTLDYYTHWNPYWSWGVVGGETVWLGMNNCTAYAFGRWNELAQVTGYNENWPIRDGADWVADGIAKGFDHGNVPQLGAAISWKRYEGDVLVSNHVAIVEEIQYDGNGNPVSFTISQSAFNHNQPPGRGPDMRGWNDWPWFWTDTVYMNDLDYGYGAGSFQGFIYHPNISPVPPTPPTPTHRKMPFILYLKRPL